MNRVLLFLSLLFVLTSMAVYLFPISGLISYFDKNNDISSSMLSFWLNNGFLIIDKFYSNDECGNLKKRVYELINSYLLEDRVYLKDNSKSKYPYLLKFHVIKFFFR